MQKNEQNIQQTWLQMTSIKIGAAICLPVLMIGQQLGKTYGFGRAIAAIIIGNGLLFLLGLIKAKMSYENKANTIENAVGYFGSAGSKILALNMIISRIGWFAIQLSLMVLSVIKSCELIMHIPLNPLPITIVLGLIMTLVGLYGITALNRLCDLSMPLLLCTIAYLVYQAYTTGVESVGGDFVDSYQGVSLVIAAAILAVVDLPTYYRFARSKKDSFISITLLFVVAIPALEAIGAYIGMRNGGANLIDSLTMHGSISGQIWILLFLVFAGWTTNNGNLYSAAVALERILPGRSLAVRTMIMGSIGTLAACTSFGSC